MGSIGKMLMEKLSELAGTEDMATRKKKAEENMKGRELNTGNVSMRSQLQQLQEEENARKATQGRK